MYTFIIYFIRCSEEGGQGEYFILYTVCWGRGGGRKEIEVMALF